MRYEKHLNMKERAAQGKTLWQAFLKVRSKAQTRKSRRKLIKNKLGPETKGGTEYNKGDDPEYQTDRDELGEYDFWGAV